MLNMSLVPGLDNFPRFKKNFLFKFFKWTESEFNKFEPRLKSAKNRFQLSAAGLNPETLNTILSGTIYIWIVCLSVCMNPINVKTA